ncbi:hypothetical protein GIB67_001973 [Kingdonia uniflora]|uniref:Uncharacterized protein n=1 Tax=Kingdonia uniflora TaxID=39325 RepID=A0A7J7MA94_9MAGN|nr:hypothetical protein GIB67_001973 [Kingdonia uniflora]
MNGVQLYTIAHFGGDIVRPKIISIVSYVGGSTKLTSLRAHSSYEDFVILLEETSEIHREDLDDNDVPQSNESFETIRTDVLPSNEPSIPQSNVHLSNEHFQTIPTDVHLSNEPCISQSIIHLSNKPVLTNVHPSNEPMLTNVHLSIKPEPIIGQTKTSAKFRLEPHPEQVKDLLDLLFKSVAYMEDPYDFSKEFNIDDLYRDKIELKNPIRAYAVVNKFNLEHALSNEYKIIVR